MKIDIVDIRKGDVLVISNENDVARAKSTCEKIVEGLKNSDEHCLFAIPVRDDTEIIVLRNERTY